MINPPASLHALDRAELIALVERAIEAGAYAGDAADLMDARLRAEEQRLAGLKRIRDEALAYSERAARSASKVGKETGFRGPDYDTISREAHIRHRAFAQADRRWKRQAQRVVETRRSLEQLRRRVA